MRKVKTELIVWCNSKLGTLYVYGAKGKVLTVAQINSWAFMYPSTYTKAYIEQSKRFIGWTEWAVSIKKQLKNTKITR